MLFIVDLEVSGSSQTIFHTCNGGEKTHQQERYFSGAHVDDNNNVVFETIYDHVPPRPTSTSTPAGNRPPVPPVEPVPQRRSSLTEEQKLPRPVTPKAPPVPQHTNRAEATNYFTPAQQHYHQPTPVPAQQPAAQQPAAQQPAAQQPVPSPPVKSFNTFI